MKKEIEHASGNYKQQMQQFGTSKQSGDIYSYLNKSPADLIKRPLVKLPSVKRPDNFKNLSTVGTLTKMIFGKDNVHDTDLSPKQVREAEPYSANLANCLSLISALNTGHEQYSRQDTNHSQQFLDQSYVSVVQNSPQEKM